MVVVADHGLALPGQQLLEHGREAFEWIDGDPATLDLVAADPGSEEHRRQILR